MRCPILSCILLFTCLAAPAAAEVGGPPVSDTEMKLLPPYCEARLKHTPGQYETWAKTLGPNFIHTHHYCYALIAINRYYSRRDPAHLTSAHADYSYVIRNAQPSYSLMPEVYLNRGVALGLMKKDGEALKDLQKALELDPKLVQAYSAASDLYAKLNQKDKALKVITEGLRRLPGNAGLQRQYTKLGGQLPYPEPNSQDDGTAATPNKAAAEAGPAGQPSAAPAEAQAKTKTAAQAANTSRNSAVYDLSRNVGAGQKLLPIVGAGAYLFVEVTEDPSAPANKVLFKISSRIPQPAAEIASIGIDTGRFIDLFTQVETKNDLLYGKHYPMKRTAGQYTHAYWPGFSPDFMAQFTTDPKESKGKLYGHRALPPGSSLTMVATLSPGRQYKDVINAMNAGIRPDMGTDGLRFGVIMHHLLGVRPDPTKTIMDDAGFVSGNLRQVSGPDVQQPAPDPTVQVDKPEPPAGPATDHTAAGSGPAGRNASPPPKTEDRTNPIPSSPETTAKPSIGTPTNPWCRFCPETSK